MVLVMQDSGGRTQPRIFGFRLALESTASGSLNFSIRRLVHLELSFLAPVGRTYTLFTPAAPRPQTNHHAKNSITIERLAQMRGPIGATTHGNTAAQR